MFADSATDMYDKMCGAIHHAVETVIPTVKRVKGIKRKVSEKTKALFKKRTEMAGTKAQYKKIQKEIKDSSMQDFHDWVAEWADTMQAANGVGNTSKICKHKCPHVGCSKVFFNSHGLKCHKGKCKWKQWYIVDRILANRWTKGKRMFKVRWSGYSAAHDTWEPRENLAPAAASRVT